MLERNSDYFSEGVDAHRDGLDACDCPYPEGTLEEAEWLVGWHAAEARSRD